MAHFLQDEWEFKSFCELLRSSGARSYLEIGSFSGGSIEVVAEYLPAGARIVSVDMPWKPQKQQRLVEVLEGLKQRGYETHLFLGDSRSARMKRKAKKFGPYDAVFIDGDHRLPFVKNDWENYGCLGQLVGFHDIAKDKHGNGAAAFWQELKPQHRHVEFISEQTRARTDGAFGIGVVWNDRKLSNEAAAIPE